MTHSSAAPPSGTTIQYSLEGNHTTLQRGTDGYTMIRGQWKFQQYDSSQSTYWLQGQHGDQVGIAFLAMEHPTVSVPKGATLVERNTVDDFAIWVDSTKEPVVHGLEYPQHHLLHRYTLRSKRLSEYEIRQMLLFLYMDSRSGKYQ